MTGLISVTHYTFTVTVYGDAGIEGNTVACHAKTGLHFFLLTSSLAEVESIAISVSLHVSLCLSVHSYISKTTCPNLVKFSVHVIYGCG